MFIATIDQDECVAGRVKWSDDGVTEFAHVTDEYDVHVGDEEWDDEDSAKMLEDNIHNMEWRVELG